MATRYVRNPKLPLKKSDLTEPPDYIPGYPMNAEDRRRYNKVLQSRSNYVPVKKTARKKKKGDNFIEKGVKHLKSDLKESKYIWEKGSKANRERKEGMKQTKYAPPAHYGQKHEPTTKYAPYESPEQKYNRLKAKKK